MIVKVHFILHVFKDIHITILNFNKSIFICTNKNDYTYSNTIFLVSRKISHKFVNFCVPLNVVLCYFI